MFTGIIERTALVTQVGSESLRWTLAVHVPWADVRLGESIAVNGVCLTIARIHQQGIGFDVVPETLAKTNLQRLAVGDAVNLERALRVGDRFDGHFVQGHVDGVAPIIANGLRDGEWRLTARAPKELTKYLVPKGSICLDGVSLTIASLKDGVFEVALIPTTLEMTTLRSRQPGWPLNLEADIFGKTIVSYLERRRDWVEDQA
jgi:riboflavin synthase